MQILFSILVTLFVILIPRFVTENFAVVYTDVTREEILLTCFEDEILETDRYYDIVEVRFFYLLGFALFLRTNGVVSEHG